MNTRPQLMLTAGETALVDALAAAGSPAAETLRKEIVLRGLPTRRVEAWHYTDLRALMKAFPAQSGKAGNAVAMPELVAAAALDFAGNAFDSACLARLPQGVSGAAAHKPGDLPEGVEIADDMIGKLNRALFAAGVELSVAAGAKVETPIAIAQAVSGGTAQALCHAVTIGADAQVTVIERAGSDGAENHQNSVTHLAIGKGAKVTWLIHQELGTATDRLAQLNISLAEDANLTLLMLNAGGRLVRQEVHIAVNGENASLAIKGVNLIGAGSHTDVTTTLNHAVPNTTATELFRNVVPGAGRGVFQGQIRVAQPAQKTDAQMACNTLLLSDESDFSAKPELEIFADDVVCAHGATVADIEDEHLFYLRARGIPEREARALLVKAFVEEVFEDIGNEPLSEALVGRIETWLDRNG
ncbi:MAG: Fe-S cluster assembly protein SufD [Nitratireductor sp.]|nr:Fe-S cluster assembly protein SufD [Nitratireductor sp.]